MRHRYWLLYLFLVVCTASKGQSITLESNQASSRCSSSAVSLSFTTSGNFSADNTFRVQLTTDSGQTFIDLPGSSVSSPASTTLPVGLVPKSSYGFRIVASKPQVVSNWGASFSIVSLPTANLTGVSTFPAEPRNPYASGLLRMKLTGGASYTLTLQDSARYVQQTGFGDDYLYDINVSPERTTTYQIASVRNACGYGTVGSTSVTVRVNPVGIQFLAAQDVFCTGTTLLAYYSTSGPLPLTHSFGAELIYRSDGNRSVSLPVSGTASPLQIQIPDELPIGSDVRLRIFDTKNGISQYYGEGQFLRVLRKPRFQFDRTRVQIAFGETVSLPFSYTSDGYGTLTSNDGRAFTINGWGRQEINVRPTETTSYSLASFSGQCDYGASFSNRQVTVEVVPGVRIDSLSAGEICVGTPVSLYYTTSPGYTLPADLLVRLGSGVQTQATVVRPGQAVFTLPESTPSVRSEQISLINRSTGNPITTAPLSLVVKTTPRVTFDLTGYVTDHVGSWTPTVNWLGGGRTEVRLSSGEVFLLGNANTGLANRYSLGEVYVTQSLAYSIVSARNECGTNEAVSSVSVNLNTTGTQPTGVYLAVDNANYTGCAGARRGFNLSPIGAFSTDNQFQVQLSDRDGQFSAPTILTVVSRAGSFSISLPTATGNYRIRVVTTNPVTRSNELPAPVFTATSDGNVILRLNSTLGSTYSVNGSLTVAAGQAIFANYSLSGQGGVTYYELSDGTKGGGGYSDYERLNPVYTPAVTTDYFIRKLVDGCGKVLTPTTKATAVVMPYVFKINAASLSPCTNLPATIGYTLNGALPAGGNFVAQLSEDGTTFQDVPTSGTSSPLSITLSKGLAGKKWYYRIAYRLNGTDITTNITQQPTLLSDVPGVTLSGQSGEQSLSIRAGSSVLLRVREEGGSGALVFLSDAQSQLISTVSKQADFTISKPGTYSIGAVYNQCGYGNGIGRVQVVEGPSLSRLTPSKTTYCEDEPISLSYVVGGQFTAPNSFTIYVVNQITSQQQRVAETANANGTFSVPNGLKAASYAVRVVSSSPSTTLTSGTVFLVQKPVQVSLVAGARAVYANELIGLSVRATGGLPCSVTFSTGETAVIRFSEDVVTVYPTQSTSYSITGVQNGCGTQPTATGVYSVSVLPTSSVTIRWLSLYGTYCTSQVVEADYMPTGTFGDDNRFTLLLSDSTGRAFQPIGTVTAPQRLTATIPPGTPPGSGYLFRVASSSPAHSGSTSFPVTLGTAPMGTLTGTTSISKGDSARISVMLTGRPPWRFVLTDFFGPRTFTTFTTPYTLTVKPDTTAGFRLTEVSNSQCGVGTATGTALITVTKLLATEPALPLQVRAWPNPTTGWLLIEGDVPGQSDVRIRVYDAAGTLVQPSIGTVWQGQLQHRIDLSIQPAGVYILTAEQEGRRSQFKVLKQ
ncbi:T9SS type A sorting domain-containing protein [Fibrella forsythiae]|uniref:T9SS type A sorting domain-containing protein n=1 Tax=Fibrella forsythiae TaxID=2817061 RepID=A0ABS3JKW7_9BACT|nr:T9SS type A sorting domain-containing protein [Fibrella forsythiae]MBO0950646.1 T9SS type A sorting domain-containing protein [Fibrella forsythiae]